MENCTDVSQGIPIADPQDDTREAQSTALGLDNLQVEIQDLVARIARLEAKYRTGGITTGGRDNALQSQDAEATKAFWRGMEVQITGVMKRPLSEPVDGGDRHNLARAVLGCLQRIDVLEAELRSSRGEES